VPDPVHHPAEATIVLPDCAKITDRILNKHIPTDGKVFLRMIAWIPVTFEVFLDSMSQVTFRVWPQTDGKHPSVLGCISGPLLTKIAGIEFPAFSTIGEVTLISYKSMLLNRLTGLCQALDKVLIGY
jgi:hypothetical protein